MSLNPRVVFGAPLAVEMFIAQAYPVFIEWALGIREGVNQKQKLRFGFIPEQIFLHSPYILAAPTGYIRTYNPVIGTKEASRN